MKIMQQLRERFSPLYQSEQTAYHRIKESLTSDGRLLSVGQMLQRAATLFPAETVLICKGQSLTYREFFAQVAVVSQKLRLYGIAPRDRVMLLYENSIEFYITYFAVWQTGAVCVPLNTFLHPRELASIIKDAEPKLIVTSTELQGKLNTLTTDKLLASLPIVCTPADLIEPVAPADIDSCIASAEPAIFQPEDLVLLLYTSGTTGTPKGVMLSSKNIITNSMQCMTRFGSAMKGRSSLHKERFFAALPLFHVFAQNSCIWFPILIGASIIVVPRIDRREILEGLKQKPTIFFGVPALYGLLCMLKTAQIAQIKLFVSGGDALPDKIRSAFAMIYGRKICSGYGLTEASPVIAVNIENKTHQTNVVGLPLADIECDIRSEEGASLGIGEIGQLWVRGDNVMQGYFHAPEETKKVLQDGWLHTGDLARFDKAGNLAIIGRSKDLIIHKGFNIYPQEVENILMSHPAVFKAAVIGKDDATTGQVPVAFVALREENRAIEESLRAFCGQHLAAYKVPRKFICLEDLPMNQTGKVDKKQLRIEPVE